MKESLVNWNNRFKSPSFWWAVGFGSGLIRPAPGTWGSLLGVLLGVPLLLAPSPFFALMAGVLAVTAISIFAINSIERQTGVHDAPEIVIDEVAGQWLAMLPLAFVPDYGIAELLASFILFRIFDIIKPWPIVLLDRHVSGGFGVMVDDLVAGVFAAAALWASLSFLL